MIRPRRPWSVLLLMVLGTIAGVAVLEAAARLFALQEDRRQGRLDRDLDRVKIPGAGAVVTLGQMIRKSLNPRIVYELRPRLDVVFAGARVTTSDAGYRGRDVDSPKRESTFRVIGIGDSYMFGQGVFDEETYLALLPSLMKERSGRAIETVNLGVPGYNTVMEVETLRARGVELEPDLIIIEIVGNDLDLPNFLWRAVDVWTPRRLFILDFVRQRLASRDDDRGGSAPGLDEAPHETTGGAAETFSRDTDHVPQQYASMVGVSAFEHAITDLSGFGRDHHVPVVAITHGVWFEDAMLQALSKNGIPVLVLRSALRQRARALGAPDYTRSPLAVSPTDLHPSALGHRAIAEELAAWIPNVIQGVDDSTRRPENAGPQRPR